VECRVCCGPVAHVHRHGVFFYIFSASRYKAVRPDVVPKISAPHFLQKRGGKKSFCTKDKP